MQNDKIQGFIRIILNNVCHLVPVPDWLTVDTQNFIAPLQARFLGRAIG